MLTSSLLAILIVTRSFCTAIAPLNDAAETVASTQQSSSTSLDEQPATIAPPQSEVEHQENEEIFDTLLDSYTTSIEEFPGTHEPDTTIEETPQTEVDGDTPEPSSTGVVEESDGGSATEIETTEHDHPSTIEDYSDPIETPGPTQTESNIGETGISPSEQLPVPPTDVPDLPQSAAESAHEPNETPMSDTPEFPGSAPMTSDEVTMSAVTSSEGTEVAETLSPSDAVAGEALTTGKPVNKKAAATYGTATDETHNKHQHGDSTVNNGSLALYFGAHSNMSHTDNAKGFKISHKMVQISSNSSNETIAGAFNYLAASQSSGQSRINSLQIVNGSVHSSQWRPNFAAIYSEETLAGSLLRAGWYLARALAATAVGIL